AGSQWGNDGRDDVADLDHVELPTGAVEDSRIGALDGVVFASTRCIRHVELDVDMGIGPVELAHGAFDLDLMIMIKHRKGMMRQRRAQAHQTDRRARYGSRLGASHVGQSPFQPVAGTAPPAGTYSVSRSR